MKSLKSFGKPRRPSNPGSGTRPGHSSGLRPRPKPKLIVLRVVRGDSMLPALKPGHIVVGTGRYALLRPGDVVIVRHGGLEKIKRVQQISKDHLFLVGDNQEHSTDSRAFGWLHVSSVSAKVVWPRLRSWPPGLGPRA